MYSLPSLSARTDVGQRRRFCGSSEAISRSLIATMFVIMYSRACLPRVASPMNFSTKRPVGMMGKSTFCSVNTRRPFRSVEADPARLVELEEMVTELVKSQAEGAAETHR